MSTKAAIIDSVVLMGAAIALSYLVNVKLLSKQAVIKDGVVLDNNLKKIFIDTNNDGVFSTKDGDVECEINKAVMDLQSLKTAFNVEKGDRLIFETPKENGRYISFHNVKAINNKQISNNFILKANEDILKEKITKQR